MQMDMVVNGESPVFSGMTFDVLYWLGLHTEAIGLDVLSSRGRLPVPVYVVEYSPKTIFTRLADPRVRYGDLTARDKEIIEFFSPTMRRLTLNQFREFWYGMNDRQKYEAKKAYSEGVEWKVTYETPRTLHTQGIHSRCDACK